MCLEVGHRAAGRLPDHVRGRDAGHRGPRRARRDPRLREPVRAPRGADRARRRGQAPSTSSASITRGATTCGATSSASPSRRASTAWAACPRPSARPSTGRESSAPPRSCGLVFASLSDEAPALDDYLGPEIHGRLLRVLRKPVEVLGRFVQALPNNWKLYVENVKDTYHASLLHAFFGTFRITRLTQGGGVLVSPDGAHHASYTIDRADDRDEHGLSRSGHPLGEVELSARRSEPARHGRRVRRRHQAADPERVPEPRRPADLQLPGRAPGRCPRGPDAHGAALDVYRLRRRRPRDARAGASGRPTWSAPRATCRWRTAASAASSSAAPPPADDEVSVVNMGGEGAESQETRATEASVRGFWKAYRRYMGT